MFNKCCHATTTKNSYKCCYFSQQIIEKIIDQFVNDQSIIYSIYSVIKKDSVGGASQLIIEHFTNFMLHFMVMPLKLFCFGWHLIPRLWWHYKFQLPTVKASQDEFGHVKVYNDTVFMLKILNVCCCFHVYHVFFHLCVKYICWFLRNGKILIMYSYTIKKGYPGKLACTPYWAPLLGVLQDTFF